MRRRSDGEPRRGVARTRRALTVWAAALLLAGCAGAGDDAAVTGSPVPTGTAVPEKQAPVVAPSGTSTADAGGGVSVSTSPSPQLAEVAGASEDNAAGADDAEGSASLDERSERIAREVFELANEARTAEDQAALEWSDCAAEQAVERAETARGKDELEHEELAFDCTATVVGENLVRGDGPASALHELWMDSEGHRDNILNGDFDRVGVGCVAHASGERTQPADDAESIGGWVCSQMFYG